MKRARPAPASARSERTFGYLAAAMAHEVRNPLNSMAIHVELLEGRAKRLASDERKAMQRSLAVLAAEVERVDQLLTHYLEQVGPEEGERTHHSVRELLEAAVDRVAASASQKKVQLKVEAIGARWAVDAQAIATALDEILNNALDASSAGGSVVVRATQEQSTGVVEISDDGEGVEAAVLSRVFALGFTTRAGRRGVGLAVAKQIIKSHGGNITLRSEGTGRGTTVRCALPLDLIV